MLATQPEQLLSVDVASDVMPTLHRVRADIGRELHAAQDALLEAENEQSRQEEEALALREQKTALKEALDKEASAKESLAAEQAAELAEAKGRTESLERQMAEERGRAGQGVSDSRASLETARKELDDFTTETTRVRKQMWEQIGCSLDMLLDHKSFVEKQLASLKVHCEEKAEAMRPLLSDDVAALE